MKSPSHKFADLRIRLPIGLGIIKVRSEAGSQETSNSYGLSRDKDGRESVPDEDCGGALPATE